MSNLMHMSQVDRGSVAQLVRVLARPARGPGFESRSAMCVFLPCDIWWLSMGPCSGCERQRDCLVGTGTVPSRGEIVAGRPCGSIAQLARVLARSATGPEFESRSGHVRFPPL